MDKVLKIDRCLINRFRDYCIIIIFRAFIYWFLLPIILLLPSPLIVHLSITYNLKDYYKEFYITSISFA